MNLYLQRVVAVAAAALCVAYTAIVAAAAPVVRQCVPYSGNSCWFIESEQVACAPSRNEYLHS